jgi:hypothetical protein
MSKSVAELCTERELTMAQFVEQSGLESNRALAIVEGRWTPSPAERAKIAAVFAVTPDEITWGHKTPIQHLWGHGPT